MPRTLTTDVCIYGGTSAGVVAALELSRLGIDSVIVHPGIRIGGLSSGGLGWTDIGNKDAIQGIAREFYQRVGAKYGVSEDWTFEPSVALEVFEDMVAEAGVTVYYKSFLDGIATSGGRIVSLSTEDGLTVSADYFIDATYEGDLMAAAGVSYTTGREANALYGERYNGQQELGGHQFDYSISPYVVAGNPASGLLPGIETTTPVTGEGDHRVQAYNFRMCLTQVADNRIPFEMPANYDRSWYVLLERYLAAGWNQVFNKFDPVNNGKTDTNNHGAVSTDFIGQNYGWPDGSFSEREQIFQAHVTYQKGLMWFLANDPAVPTTIRNAMSLWGLAADEFLETGGWPCQLYIRESRRMVSDYVITEHDVFSNRLARDSVGLAAYGMDSHNCRRFVNDSGDVRNEGNVQVGGFSPYPLSYRSIVPREGECQNLAVPLCISSSHIAFGSIRMEPVFMILGQSAAVAIAQARLDGRTLQQVDTDLLQETLEERGQRLYWQWNPDNWVEGTVIDSEDANSVVITGQWLESTSVAGYSGLNYLHDDNSQKGQKSVLFNLDVPVAGIYEVYLRWTAHENRATNVPVRVIHDGGHSDHVVNQRINGGRWNLVGEYSFAERGGTVVISTAETDGYVIADAVLYAGSVPETCEEIIAAGRRMACDVSGPEGEPDCRVDFYDLAELARQWMLCNDPTPECIDLY
ncbi:MAG: FAD-dependent oxidoreductase [Sedimentisphaerales bacterium]|nr:FAD-dependent oxidoreductase [Sedimentisphaerales bacterium]